MCIYNEYLYPSLLRIGYTHLVWNSLDSEAEVRKDVTKARILTGVYILQSNRHPFSGKTIDSMCQLCCLEEEDLYYMVTLCPAFHDIRMYSVERLKQIVVKQSGGSVWCSTFESWDTIMKVLICPDCVTPLVPRLSYSLNNIENVSRTLFYKVHLKRLKLLGQRE